MSVYDMWCVCDRCSFEYRRKQMRVESTGALVCRRCNDGRYDIKRHPQNKSARPRREGLPVPDGTPPLLIRTALASEMEMLLLTEDGNPILVNEPVWTPRQSVYYYEG